MGLFLNIVKSEEFFEQSYELGELVYVSPGQEDEVSGD
jgi:hypothetical protein